MLQSADPQKIEPRKNFVLYVHTLICTLICLVGAAAYTPIPSCGNITIAAASQLKLATVVFNELAEKPVRINEVIIVTITVNISTLYNVIP